MDLTMNDADDLEQAPPPPPLIDSPTSDDDSDDASLALSETNQERPSRKELAATQERQTLARQETQAVHYLRIALLILLACTAVGVALAVYFYIKDSEEADFETRFTSVGWAIINSFHDAFENKLGALDALSVATTSYALSSPTVHFPNVTIPSFEVLGANTRVQADGIYIFWCPLVQEAERTQWEAFAQENQGHLLPSFVNEQALAAGQDAAMGFHGDGHRQLHANHNEYHAEIHPLIWGGDGNGDPEPVGSGPYLPLWQITPVLPLISLLNFNMFAFEELVDCFHRLIESGKAVADRIFVEFQDTDQYAAGQQEGGTSTEDLVNAFLQYGQYRHDTESYRYDPLTPVAYPVFDNFTANRTVVGMLYTSIYWRLMFDYNLPDDVEGVICVLQNTFGQTFTFSIDRGVVEYRGIGDLHDPAYDHMVLSRNVASYLAQRASPDTRSYTTVDLDDAYSSYTIFVYPSKAMEDQFVTNEPLVFTLVIGSVFVFTSLVFLIYDWCVRRRQRKVLDKAVKSSAVVSTLFPATVRDRLYEDGSSKDAKNWKSSREKRLSVKEFLADGQVLSDSHHRSRPIADQVPECTIFFADIAGFTQWCSDRDPEQVFALLETLYGALDTIALRRDVFKVETIGDCYMAVTGLPHPQPDHAVIMVKFARDCLLKLKLLTHELQEDLGTQDLAFRIGLHSGPVTAGVLRGDKARFQLFGDTVNMASRMESTGSPGRIQCSEATADQLRAAGHVSWLTARDEEVQAKGKGGVQTYWVRVPSSSGGKTSSLRSGRTSEPSLSSSDPATTIRSTRSDSRPDDKESPPASPSAKEQGYHSRLYPSSLRGDARAETPPSPILY